ncbi:hypothetical protein FTUN_8400 [Frigoriglobus tundricola]|uniref:Uncharacterized protein n=1 Tax=Frigoriglobus tundricola TaxID=2774151 RepID=A0A6M5Z5D0_9BACT|nr:hypothetical protein FTUN_8400 [Frigoriglobus tundricola]
MEAEWLSAAASRCAVLPVVRQRRGAPVSRGVETLGEQFRK